MPVIEWKDLKQLVNFLSCHGPSGVEQVAALIHRGEDTRTQGETTAARNEHKWREVTKDDKAFISNRERERERERESEGHTGVQCVTRPALILQSIVHPSIHPSILCGRSRDMKRPHDYSSPDSDTDEFIDVGQEDGFWWASANHSWVCVTHAPQSHF